MFTTLFGSGRLLWSKGATRRFASAHAPVRPQKRRTIAITSGLMLAGSAAVLAGRGIYADNVNEEPTVQRVPLSVLFRSYLVYSMCSMPLLVDWSPSILSALSSIPGIKQVTELFIRHTFFSQFVGGDTAQDCATVMKQLRSENKGCLFAYSIEVDESEAIGGSQKFSRTPVHKRIVEEMIHSIDVAADFEDQLSNSAGRKTWVAVKMTALLPDAQSLINLSKYIVHTRPQRSVPVAFPGSPSSADLDILGSSKTPEELTAEDLTALKELHEDLFRICTRAKERGVKVIIDAEYSWYQPAVDAYTLSLSRTFNKLNGATLQPLVYGTYQAYLRRTPSHLKQSFLDAEKGNYALGVKLVRGAYHEYETAAHLSPTNSLSISDEPEPPVFRTKAETDECYNSCAKMLVQRVKGDIESARVPSRIGILFGTHNIGSCTAILDDLLQEKLAVRDADGKVSLQEDVLERLCFAQLLGMKDELTEWLVNNTRSANPVVMKYVPYGALSEVMPYLSRRAIENKSVLGNGGAAQERRRVGTEIRRRLFGFII